MISLIGKLINRDSTNPSHRGKVNENYVPMLELRNDNNTTNTITTVGKDNVVLEIDSDADHVCIKTNNKKGYERLKIGGAIDMNYVGSSTRRGRVIDNGDVVGAMTTQSNNYFVTEKFIWKIGEDTYRIRIRRLTPLECWRLMGFSDVDFSEAKKVNSDTQLYCQAGNSIVVPVLEGIFRNLIECLKVNNQPKRKGKPVPHQGTFGFW